MRKDYLVKQDTTSKKAENQQPSLLTRAITMNKDMDVETTLDELKQEVQAFCEERD